MKIETSYTPEEIIEYAKNDFVVAAQMFPDFHLGKATSNYNSKDDNYVECSIESDYPGHGNVAYVRGITNCLINRYPNDNERKIGIIRGTLDDGSFCVDIIGNGIIDRQNKKYINTRLSVSNTYQLKYINASHDYYVDLDGQTTDWAINFHNIEYKENRLSGQTLKYTDNPYPITMAQASMYEPNWETPAVGFPLECFFYQFAKLNNQNVSAGSDNIELTNNPNTSLRVGNLFDQYLFFSTKSSYCYNGYKNIGGDVFSFLYERSNSFDTFALGSLRWYNQQEFPQNVPAPDYADEGTYCAHWVPFNLILTRNENEAVDYLNTGKLPSDAFIYPYDVDNVPLNTDGIDPGNEPTDVPMDDTPNEDGTPIDDCNPMPTEEPDYTPQSLTNNNLYWLSAQALNQFIDWFWTDATDVASLGDLWDKITGLYENLAEAVLQIRYMPIDISWIGGTTGDTKIVVGMIEKSHAVQKINRSVAPIRRIGTIDVSTINNGSWVNYTPYSSCSLYLPFHGMVSLDNDFIMNHKLCVEAVYDIISGTIQYYIHRDSYEGSLVYSTIARMAVDIPISLQTKTERDSAILQNVANVTAGLIGAGASAAVGSPVGMTMGMSNLASYQPTSAGMHVVGTVGESGSFYAPKKCALYIKRPAYNRPSNYKSRVGYPANTTKKLKNCSGFTTCYQPRITFAGNDYDTDGIQGTMKPLQSEVQEIYELLEKGVIL